MSDMTRGTRTRLVPPLTRFRAVEPHLTLVLVALALVLAAAIGPLVHRSFGGMAWLGLILVWAGLTYFAASVVAKHPARSTIWVVLVGAALMRLPLLVEPPYLSSDMYRYVWDGRVQGNGINPYLYEIGRAHV